MRTAYDNIKKKVEEHEQMKRLLIEIHEALSDKSKLNLWEQSVKQAIEKQLN